MALRTTGQLLIRWMMQAGYADVDQLLCLVAGDYGCLLRRGGGDNKDITFHSMGLPSTVIGIRGKIEDRVVIVIIFLPTEPCLKNKTE